MKIYYGQTDFQTNITNNTSKIMKKVREEASEKKHEYVTISRESRQKYAQHLQLNNVQKGDKLGELFKNFFASFNKEEAIEQIKVNDKESMHIDITYHFPENTLHHTIQQALEGKVANASHYAAELANAIRSFISFPEKNIEERALIREVALKQATFIAETYFDDEQEAGNFLIEVTTHYENDLLREQGYVALDGSDVKPFKSYSSPLNSKNEVSFYHFIKNHLNEDELARFLAGDTTPQESRKLLQSFQQNKRKMSEEKIKESAFHEQIVEETIAIAKASVDALQWKNGQLMKPEGVRSRFLDDLIKWNNALLQMFIK